ncbi:tyrosine-type recombinase/integrase [Dietzia cinnamea]|uniref:tyrosine-type recombinase/integrase n=1 Tax=Dietzia cinnamea TaxID=321318 RepID=UPI00223A7A77|nr:site-specific integrase [Dietzia cinnamea]MCT2076503.1 site-specific integrase [Dietzia cinnamea]MCT2220620.1 site-specific integrase [Dietzia cinnamea]
MGNKRGTRRGFGAIRKLPSGRYQAHYVGPDGAKHKAPATFHAHDDAAAWCAHERRLVDLGVWTAPADRQKADEETPAVVLAEYARTWLDERNLKPSTRTAYRSKLETRILPELGQLELTAITPAVVRRWHSALVATPSAPNGGRDRSGATRNAHCYALLRTILGTAVDDGLIEANPCRIRGASQSKRVHEIEVLPPGALERLAAEMPDETRLVVLLAAWCGLRRGEVLALRRRDIEPDGTEVHVRRGVTFIDSKPVFSTPKTAAGARDVSVPPHVVPAVVDHLERHVGRGRDSLLFTGKADGVLDEWTLRRTFKAAAESIDRPGLRFHDLRHQGAVLAARAGATTKELMTRLGHTTPAMSMRYQHAAAGRDAEIAARMSKIAEGNDDG